ncbi:MAG: dihydrofolate reductase [Gammaproteobacteria bacterium]|nr:dihydrofolate reductase [Gammaproteobacteria bacterium]
MNLSIVVAMASNGIIGRNGDLPWRLSADLRHFKAITMGKPIVMGRLTHESIGRPLPGRDNIVLTRDHNYTAVGCSVIHDLQSLETLFAEQEAMIIGGAQIYADTLPFVKRLYLTEVHAEVEGDVCFPVFKRDEWTETSRDFHLADEKNDYDYSFVTLARL